MGSDKKIKPRLVIIEGKDKGKVISLEDGTAVLGRSKADVLIHDARISRSHVAIHYSASTGKLSFTDLKSLNGTIVNGTQTESGELNDGDKIQLGNTLLDIQIGQSEGTISRPDISGTGTELEQCFEESFSDNLAKAMFSSSHSSFGAISSPC